MSAISRLLGKRGVSTVFAYKKCRGKPSWQVQWQCVSVRAVIKLRSRHFCYARSCMQVRNHAIAGMDRPFHDIQMTPKGHSRSKVMTQCRAIYVPFNTAKSVTFILSVRLPSTERYIACLISSVTHEYERSTLLLYTVALPNLCIFVRGEKSHRRL